MWSSQGLHLYLHARKNYNWSSWGTKVLIASCDEQNSKHFEVWIAKLRKTYNSMTAIYRKSKNEGADIPLK